VTRRGGRPLLYGGTNLRHLPLMIFSLHLDTPLSDLELERRLHQCRSRGGAASSSSGVGGRGRDGNGSASDRVECLGTQNRNPNLKPETDLNTYSGENSCPKPNPRISETRLDTQNLLRMATYEEQSRLL
jgi:hypothetical protein